MLCYQGETEHADKTEDAVTSTVYAQGQRVYILSDGKDQEEVSNSSGGTIRVCIR